MLLALAGIWTQKAQFHETRSRGKEDKFVVPALAYRASTLKREQRTLLKGGATPETGLL